MHVLIDQRELTARILSLAGKGKYYGSEKESNVLLLPIKAGEKPIYGAYYLGEASKEKTDVILGLSGLLTLPLSYSLREQQYKKIQERFRGLENSLIILDQVQKAENYKEACAVLCSKVAELWKAERVVFSRVNKNLESKLIAINDSSLFNRKSELVNDLEKCAEECGDQRVTIVYPALENSKYIFRSHKDFHQRYGVGCILSIPIYLDNKVIATCSIERTSEFSVEEIQR